jgi:3'-phosphoadenosine 5'-phosphosulfate sulfotransferase (PAPS reductase)/FAD synthetase
MTPSKRQGRSGGSTFYGFSGGMESAAMLVVECERILDTKAHVCWADTGKQFPEMAASIRQIEARLGIKIVTVPRRITFDEFLFERGGIIRRSTTDCSRRMKRGNLTRYMKTFPKPYEWNIGFNSGEDERADDFVARNARDWMYWRFPLIEADISREKTWAICREAGFTILIEMYEKMGRFDCFWCGNQTKAQALKVVKYYPALAQEWMDAEARKGFPFMGNYTPLKVLVEQNQEMPEAPISCGCFAGKEDFFEEESETEEVVAESAQAFVGPEKGTDVVRQSD